MRGVAAAIGVVFGFTLAWAGLSEPDVIRAGLLFEDFYLFFVFAAALATASIGVHLLRGFRVRALLTRDLVTWERPPLARRHVVGSVLFGAGWAISAACPGPVIAQIGSGVVWALATFTGLVIGIRLFLARQKEDETAPEVAPIVT